MPSPTPLRDSFPVCADSAYLNAGTNGPIPHAAIRAMGGRWEHEAAVGRSGDGHWRGVADLDASVRARLARLLGSRPEELVLTRSTTEGINLVLAGLRWRAGDEVLTSTEEHPGVLAPLGQLRRLGVTVRMAPLERLPDAVGPRTRLVVCSHVTWTRGAVAPTERLAGCGVPILYDGAQGPGCVPVDVAKMDCAFYAAAGQKWLCGPAGTGVLYAHPDRTAELGMPWPNYGSLADASRPLLGAPAPGAAGLSPGEASAPLLAALHASIELLEGHGWTENMDRAATLADRLRSELSGRGRAVLPGAAPLVGWREPDPEPTVRRLAAAGVVVRAVPGRGALRASVGTWNDESDLRRLLGALDEIRADAR
ncbi:MAG: aminotransferase class V-fold PLP-dependent enzyme [Solirubrobacterales bacterium]